MRPGDEITGGGNMRLMRALCCVGLLLLALPGWADRLVFGAFASQQNAQNWAKRVASRLQIETKVATVVRADGQTLYRVISEPLAETQLLRLRSVAERENIKLWRMREQVSVADTVGPAPTEPVPSAPAEAPAPPANADSEAADMPVAAKTRPAALPTATTEIESNRTLLSTQTSAYAEPADPGFEIEWDVGLQSRWFAQRGHQGQQKVQGAVSLAPEFYKAWQGDRHSVTFAPFLRVDSLDDERSHFDVRELFYSYVGENWELHAGARRVFWGVTEFHHLVDIINQTDLVENIDTEDKLGQPMLQYTYIHDLGTLDVFLLTGFRERTFPSLDGRLNAPLPILDEARYASGSEELRTDFAIRWSQQIGALEFGVHHFSGTSRDPIMEVAGLQPALRAFYPVIDQTGVDAQLIQGDWALKLEGFSRSGFGDRYAAVNLGLERTLVGVLGSSADFGIVAEYMFDERGEDAFNTLFENDVALGGRLAFNDFANTQALVGVIVDADRSEYVWSLEASRQLGDAWSVSLEGRVFQGGRDLQDGTLLQILSDPEFKSAWLQQEDYLQLEFTRFF